MANPSAVPASAAGTEILRRQHSNATTTGDTDLLVGVANYTYTILSIIICETADAAETFTLMVSADDTTRVDLIVDQALPAKGTFVFDNKFIMTGTDQLILKLGSSGNVDILVSYIENRWA